MTEAKTPGAEKSQAEKPEISKPASTQSTASGRIARAMFTNAIVDREPAEPIESLTTDFEKVYFFTEFVGMEGRQITHQWIYDGKVVAEVPFQVGGPRWRVYSSKKLLSGWVGQWTVAVVDETGKKLREASFAYVSSSQ